MNTSHSARAPCLSPPWDHLGVAKDSLGKINVVHIVEHPIAGTRQQPLNWFCIHQKLFLHHYLRHHPLNRPLWVPLLSWLLFLVLLMQMVAWGMMHGFMVPVDFSFHEVFSVTWVACFHPPSTSLPSSLPPCLSLPCALLPSPRKPREIDKQQDRGNWAILFLLWEAHFAAFIWKLSFSTSLGMSSYRPMTPKCLCWSIVPVSYWHAHWQLSLSTGPGSGSQL